MGDLMTRRARAGRLLKRLLREDRGSAYALMAASFIPALGFVGTGIDLGRAYLAQSRLQAAVDAAVMAGVRAQQVDPATGADSLTYRTVESYLTANFPLGYASFTRNAPVIEVERSGTNISVKLTATGSVPTSLMHIFGFAQLPVEAAATAEAGETLPRATEVMLVLDNTGSMNAGGRIGQLKEAAKSFVEVIYGKDIENRDNFAIGMLPYNTMVNVGRLLLGDGTNAAKRALFDSPAAHNSYLTATAATAFGWKGCVFADETKLTLNADINVMDADVFDLGKTMPGERTAGGTKDMPKLSPFIYPPVKVWSFQDVDNRYRYPDAATAKLWMNYGVVKQALLRMHGARAAATSICSKNGSRVTCSTSGAEIEPSYVPEYNDTTKWKTPKVYTHTTGTNNSIQGMSPNYQCPAQALPIAYGRTQTALRTYIDEENTALEPGTGTFHNPAMTWAYRMMARTDFFPRATPGSMPLRRTIVFMTDGNFDSQDDGRTDESGTKVYDSAYTAYKSYEDKLVTTATDKPSTVAAMSKRFAKTCQAMKAEGIEIYTIAFALDNNAQGNATREMFKTCATNRTTHFFSVASGPDLKGAFTTIAADLVDLHLSK